MYSYKYDSNIIKDNLFILLSLYEFSINYEM